MCGINADLQEIADSVEAKSKLAGKADKFQSLKIAVAIQSKSTSCTDLMAHHLLFFIETNSVDSNVRRLASCPMRYITPPLKDDCG